MESHPTVALVPEPVPERVALEKAIGLAGSEEKLGELIGYSQPAVNKAKKRGRASAEMAAKIDAALAPQITKSDLRPDLWPPEQSEAA